MDYIGIFKAAHHMYDGIHLADIAQKLVSQPFAFGCPLYQACNIYKLDYRRGHLLRMVHIPQQL